MVILKKLDELKCQLSSKFEMKDLGMAMKILGMEKARDRSKGFLWLRQEGHLQKLIDRFGFSDVKPVNIPFTPHIRLSSKC